MVLLHSQCNLDSKIKCWGPHYSSIEGFLYNSRTWLVQIDLFNLIWTAVIHASIIARASLSWERISLSVDLLTFDIYFFATF